MKTIVPGALILALLGVLLALLLPRLTLDYRLDGFLPASDDPARALVADQLGDSAAGRVILAALHGPEHARLVELAPRLAAAWTEIPGVSRVDFGPPQPDAANLAPLLEQRFALTPDPAARVAPEAIRQSLESRLADLALGGAEASFLIEHDPLGLVDDLALALLPVDGPASHDEVWFDATGERALMMITTEIAGFELVGQAAVVSALRRIAAAMDEHGELALTLTGPAVFASDSAAATRADAIRLSLLAGVWVLLLLAVAWRRAAHVVAGAVPLLAGVLAGVLMLMLGFPAVHGMALAFGFTLLGVAMDFPVHLFAHQGNTGSPAASARRIAQPLLLSAASTLIAFTAIWLSASPGLAQLGAFSAVGLAAAALVTLLVVPRLRAGAPAAAPDWVRRLLAGPRAPWLAPVVLVLAAIGLLATGERLFSNDLARLSPIDATVLQQDQALRDQLGAPDVRRVIVAHGEDLQALLAAGEKLDGALQSARAAGLLDDWQSVTSLVPSIATQQARMAAWPARSVLAGRLAAAGRELGFRADVFRPFLDDLDAAREQPPITPDTWRETPLATRVETLLHGVAGGWRLLAVPAGTGDTGALRRHLERYDGPGELVDLVALSADMVTDYRRQVLLSLGVALLLIAALIAWRLRTPGMIAGVLLPPLAAVAATAWLMAQVADGLSIVHLMALILVAGIGIDYALFMQRFGGRSDDASPTLWALLICAASTGGVFAILATSNITMLAQLGATAASGITLALLFAWTQRPPCPD